MQRSAQINKVFVYLLSVIMVLFVGFLIVQFVATFGDDVKRDLQNRLYETIERDYEVVQTSYGSEKTYTYQTPERVGTLCFVSDVNACFNTDPVDLDVEDSIRGDLEEIVNAGGDNSVMFTTEGQIIQTRELESFKTSEGCFCTKTENNQFSLTFENRRNTVWLYDEKDEETSSPIP